MTNPLLKLRLVKENDAIKVKVVDESGEEEIQGKLVKFRKDGTIRLYTDVNKEFGFKLDKNGRIKVTREE